MKAAEERVPEIFPASFEVSLHTGGADIISRFADEWENLCAHAADNQPFYLPRWIQAYLRAFAPDAKVVLVIVRLHQELRLVLPLLRETVWLGGILLRKWRAPVNSHPGRFDAVRSSGPEGDAAVRAAWDHIKRTRDWDLLELAHVPDGGTVARLAEAARALDFHVSQVSQSPGPYIPVPTDRDLLNKMPLNAKLRSQLRQARRRLEEEAPLTLRRIEVLDRSALQRFYDLEASGWKGQDGSAIMCHADTHQFYDDVSAIAVHSKFFSLYLLEWNDQLLAAHFGLSLDGLYYCPKVAYDERFSKFAPGHLILNEILNDCAARGIREIDITGPADEWKMKWTDQVRPKHTYFIFNKSLAGNLAYGVRFRLRPIVSRLWRRKGRTT